jgi:hypothetical protein
VARLGGTVLLAEAAVSDARQPQPALVFRRRGAWRFLDELLKRKLFDAELAIRAACAIDEVFCWLPFDEDSAEPGPQAPGLLIDTAVALKHRGLEVGVQEVEKAYLAYKGQTFTPSELANLVVLRLGKSASRELGRRE